MTVWRMLYGFAVSDSVQRAPELGEAYPKPEPAATFSRPELLLPGCGAGQRWVSCEVGDQGISEGLKLTCAEEMFGLWFRRPPGRRVWEMGVEREALGQPKSSSNQQPSRSGEGRVKTPELFKISACEIFHKHL